MSGRLPARYAMPILSSVPAGQTLGEIIALIRSWQAPVLPTPGPMVWGTVMGSEASRDSRNLSVTTIAALFVSS